MSQSDTLIRLVRERIDGALFQGKAPPSSRDLAADLGVSVGAASVARGVVLDAKVFTRGLRPIIVDDTRCVCGHERQDHTRKGRCTEEHAHRAGHHCPCVDFSLPMKGKAWKGGEAPIDLLLEPAR